ncbi:MAG: hydrogenase, partial [Candidatus Delongbacteria bacterium]|nr:hydrogenase [Candidatus Delongbacteria bacterium]
MIALILILPLVISLILYGVKSQRINHILNLGYATFFLGAAGRLMVCPGGFTDYFQVDPLNRIFLGILALLYWCVSLYNGYFFKKSPVSDLRHTQFHIFMLVFIFSLAGATLSTHLALYWVFLEATTLSSAYLIYFERTSSSLEAAWKYMFICSIGIALAFVGIILLSIGHASGHSLFFKDLYHQAAEMDIFWLKLSFTFILIGLGTKMGLAPVHAWLPDAHSESPSPVSA